MPRAPLHVVVRTPHAQVVDDTFDSMRLPTETGAVGLRPGSEPGVLVVEPGVIFLRTGGTTRFLATAGGVLRGDRDRVELFTPMGWIAEDEESVRDQLERALERPSEEATLRREMERLEAELLRELRRGDTSVPPRGRTA